MLNESNHRKSSKFLNSISLGVLGLSFFLSGCQAPSTSSRPETRQVTVPNPSEQPSVDLKKVVKATRPWKIVFVSQDGPRGHENIPPQDCQKVVWCHMWQVASQKGQELGADMELAYVQEECVDEQQCIYQQIQLLNTILEEQEIDGIIIGPRDSNRLVPIIEKMIASNIAVMSVGTPINSSKVQTMVTFNDFEGGKSIGDWIAKQLNNKGNVLILEGPKYQKNALERRRGFLAGLQGTDITILDTEEVLWSCDGAQKVTQEWLAKYPNVDAVITASDHMAIGALQATLGANRPDILITGYDALPISKAAILSGALDATIEIFPKTTTPTAVQLMIRYLETGETFPPTVLLPDPKLITKANVPTGHSPAATAYGVENLTCNF